MVGVRGGCHGLKEEKKGLDAWAKKEKQNQPAHGRSVCFCCNVVQRWCGCVCDSVEDGCVVMLCRGGLGVFVAVCEDGCVVMLYRGGVGVFVTV